MESLALFVRLEAKPGKEAEVETFLKSALSLVQQEPGTQSWYALKLGPSAFGIFDTFENDASRNAHLTGKVAEALKARSAELFVHVPVIEKVELLAVKPTGARSL